MLVRNAFVLLLLAPLASCDLLPASPEGSEIEGEWRFLRGEIEGEAIVAADLPRPFTVRFTSAPQTSGRAGALAGSSGCNGFQGRYRIETSGRLSVHDASSSDAYCGLANSRLEQAVLGLRGGIRYGVRGGHLHLRFSGGEAVFRASSPE